MTDEGVLTVDNFDLEIKDKEFIVLVVPSGCGKWTMLPIFDGLRDVTLTSVTIRMLLAVLCGGIIGLEQAYKRRPAGFRTHILICLGAAITTLTSQYLYLNLHYYTDMARLGAQVVAGIGFIGAGTIVVTRQQRVKGLTTAGRPLGFRYYRTVHRRRLLRGCLVGHGTGFSGRVCAFPAGISDAGSCSGDQPLYGVC